MDGTIKCLMNIQKEIARSNRFELYKELYTRNYISEDCYKSLLQRLLELAGDSRTRIENNAYNETNNLLNDKEVI